MNYDGIYSAISVLADIGAVAGELAEHHTDDRSARVFNWLAREIEKAQRDLLSCAREVADED